MHSPVASRPPFATSAIYDSSHCEPIKPRRVVQKKQSKIGRWFSHVRERLIMRLVCCAPASVALEVEFEDDDDYGHKLSGAMHGVVRQPSASIVPIITSSTSDRDIPTNEELEQLPIDLSFVLNDDVDDAQPPPTPRHSVLVERMQQLTALREQQSARLIQRRWRQFLIEEADNDEEPETTKVTTTAEAVTPTKNRRRRIRKHRGRKKKRSN